MRSQSVSIPEGESGWIKFPSNRSENRIYVPVEIAGMHAVALIDTGVTRTILDDPFAKKLRSRTPGARWFVEEGVKMLDAKATVRIGKVRFDPPQPFEVQNFADVARGTIRPQLTLGYDFVMSIRWQVDFDKHRTRFLRSCGSLERGRAIPLSNEGKRLLTTVTLNGVEVPSVEIDTGNDGDLALMPEIAEQAGLRPVTDVQASWLGDRSIMQIMPIGDLRFGSFEFRDKLAAVSNDVQLHVDRGAAMLGMGVLNEFNFTLDAPANMLIAERRRTKPQRARKTTTGLQLTFSKGRLLVDHVMLNSPAASAGIIDGDVICRLNSRPIPKSENGRAKVLELSQGSTLQIELCSKKRVTLVGRHFF